MSIPSLSVHYGEIASLVIGPLSVGENNSTVDLGAYSVTMRVSPTSWEDPSPPVEVSGTADPASESGVVETHTIFLDSNLLPPVAGTWYCTVTITPPVTTRGWPIKQRYLLEIETTETVMAKEELQQFLRDYGEFNILLDDVQFSTSEMKAALRHAESEFTLLPPVNVGGTLPRALLLLGAASWLMKSESFLQVRNHATYQDGDIAPIGVDDKFAMYIELAQRLKADWAEASSNYKQSINMEGGYGSLSSGYRNVGRYYNN